MRGLTEFGWARETEMKMTRKWWMKTEPLYRKFSGDGYSGKDSDEAEAMYQAETFGGVQPDPASNRYACGKRNMDATASMWREDVAAGLLMKFELLEDKTLGGVQWWVKRSLGTMAAGENALGFR